VIGKACSTHGRHGEMRVRFWSRNIKGRDHSKDVDIDWRIILE